MKSEYVTFIIGIAILCSIPVMIRGLKFLVKMGFIYAFKALKAGVIRIFKIAHACLIAPFTKNTINWRRVFGLKVKKFDLNNVSKNERGETIDVRAAGYEFEKFVRDIYSAYGYQTFQGRAAKKVAGLYPPEFAETKGDGGIDGIYFGAHEIIIAQTKLQKSDVTGEHIMKTAGARDIFANYYKTFDRRPVRAILFTNSTIDNTAKMFAKSHNVFVYQKDDLNELIKQANKMPA